MENYLRSQLEWDAQEGENEREQARARGEEWWTRGSVAKVRPNDWAYSIPHDVR